MSAENTSTTHIQASLGDGSIIGGKDYILNEGDSLLACVGNNCRGMEMNDLAPLFLLGIHYSTDLPYQGNTEYIVSLYRNGQENAPNSRVTLPETFDIIEPAPGTTYTDGDTVVVSWLPITMPSHRCHLI